MSNQTLNERLSAYSGVFLVIGLLIFIIAWIAPAYGDGSGLDAYKASYGLLFNLGENWHSQPTLDKIMLLLCAISPHTNYIFAIAVLILLLNRQGINKTLQTFLANLLFFSFVINLVWLYAFKETLQDLKIGYYLWAVSFFVIGFAAYSNIPAKDKPATPVN